MKGSTPTYKFSFDSDKTKIRLVGYRGGVKRTYARGETKAEPTQEDLLTAIENMTLQTTGEQIVVGRVKVQ